MDGTTTEDRKKELKVLLAQMETQPSRDWTEQRERIVILQKMIAADEQQPA